MAFKQTLQSVQTARSVAVLSTCVSVILFSFTFQNRILDTHDIVEQIVAAGTSVFGADHDHAKGFSSTALFGLALSLAWNGLSLVDLSLQGHYRFERRICMFLDMGVASILMITGFLNFTYDAFLYYEAKAGSQRQMIMETAAVCFLGLSCLFHLGFFCYGCTDSTPASRSRTYRQFSAPQRSFSMGTIERKLGTAQDSYDSFDEYEEDEKV